MFGGVLIRGVRRGRRIGIVSALLAAGVLFGSPAEAAPPATAATAPPATAAAVPVTPYASLNNLFQNYGNSSGQWSGGDGTQSLKLPDGRVVWFFNDSYYGSVESNGTRRPFAAVMPRNMLVIQNGSTLTSVAGSGSDRTMVPPAAGGDWLWGGDNMLVGGTIYKFYQRFKSQPGGGAFGFYPTGVELVAMPVSTLTNPATFTKVSIPSPICDGSPNQGSRCYLWGTALYSTADHTYIYGTEGVVSGSDPQKYLHIARVPKGQFTAAWEYWTGSGWSSSQAASKRVLNGVAEGFSVTQHGGQYVLLTQGLEGALAGNMIAYHSGTPTGFTATERSVLHMTPETTTDWGDWTYEYRVVPHLSSGSTVVVSYNLNSQYQDGACLGRNYYTASVYRPRFIQFTLPSSPIGGSYIEPTKAPIGSPWTLNPPAYCANSSSPGPAPTAPTATATSGARITFAWTAPTPAGKYSYDVRWRDATAGAAWNEFPLFAPDSTSVPFNALTHGHRYEFQVRAVTWAGNYSSWTSVVSATAFLSRPTNMTAFRWSASECTAQWTDSQPDVLWRVYWRELPSGTLVRANLPTSQKTMTIMLLDPAKRYGISVAAENSHGEGPRSTEATCPTGR
ncbi:DUF5005 domain-containing protein [Actinomadura rudentiformis]|uniref:DUF5005 domain-containing protein n=1 Tax=Actinomadura rudentiformis TaxID=359158 RepID=A0A6H9Z850_9ACTN|nr:DUF5005 domain-containing protein [Actinomadura rudentiformis]KAB2352506.1 DUF5005 domain-containing protein [Actinomadura rudentiformis]